MIDSIVVCRNPISSFTSAAAKFVLHPTYTGESVRLEIIFATRVAMSIVPVVAYRLVQRGSAGMTRCGRINKLFLRAYE